MSKFDLKKQLPNHSIEGIDRIPLALQIASPTELFWIWCSANIGVLGILYGAIIMSFGLSFFQATLVMLLGLTTFGLVGITAIAGFRGRTNTLTLSRRAFGLQGNILPTFFSWAYLMGWEAINLVIGTFTLLALCQVFGVESSPLLTLICLGCFASLIILISFLGLNGVMRLQKILTQIFGAFTLLVVIYIFLNANWVKVFALPNGNWLTGFLPALSIIMAGTGIGWTIAGADYSRTQKINTPCRAIFFSVIGGAGFPLLLLMLAGVLLSVDQPELARANNPIAMIQKALPNWMSIPYLVAAIGAMMTLGILSLYSASLTLQTLGVKAKQTYAVGINALLVLMISMYILFVSEYFMHSFMTFLFFCGLILSGWSAIFLIDFLINPIYSDQDLFKTSGANIFAILCWIFSVMIGLSMSKIGDFSGPFVIGIFENSKLGILITFAASGIFYSLYRCICYKK